VFVFIFREFDSGRNFYEVIRLFDALQLATYHHVVTPANWGLGQDVVVNNDVTDEEAEDMFPKGFVTIKKWFRLVTAPDNSNDMSSVAD
jgi:peroxiredoxin